MVTGIDRGDWDARLHGAYGANRNAWSYRINGCRRVYWPNIHRNRPYGLDWLYGSHGADWCNVDSNWCNWSYGSNGCIRSHGLAVNTNRPYGFNGIDWIYW